jgi:hypothetical protein
MMTRRNLGLCLLVFLFAAGCASLKPVPLDPDFWRQKGGRVGIVLEQYPPAQVVVDVSTINMFAGQRQYIYGGTLNSPEFDYEPLRYSEMQPLRDAVARMTPDPFFTVRDYLVQGLRERGFDAFKLERPLVVKDLPKFKEGSGEGIYADRDFREVGRSVHADYLLLIDLVRYGPYAHYLDLNNDYMEVRAQTRAELLDAKTNRILWRTGYKEGDHRKAVNAIASRPDQIPAVIEAQKDLLSEVARALSREFFSSGH